MMNEQQQLLLVKGLISELPGADKEACLEAAKSIRCVVKSAGTVGLIALTLVGLEEQANS